jgi:DNA-binding LacI/PurR family transcriptional regulator
LGYRPNILARSLAAGRTRTLGVVTTEFYRFGPSRIATGIQQRCQELGYLLLVEWLGSPDDPARHLNELAGRQVDAIVWLGPEMDGDLSWATPDCLNCLPPLVFCDFHSRPGLHMISTDNRAAAADVTRHLMAQGRRCIGLITGPRERAVARDRLAGWQDALGAAGIEPAATWVSVGDWSPTSGAQACRELLARNPKLDAVLASNDRMALGVLHATHEAGRRVPQDLAVAGIDNIPEAAFFTPPLTTVQQPLQEMGRAAAELAIQLAEARWHKRPEPAETAIVLPSELIIRASSVLG